MSASSRYTPDSAPDCETAQRGKPCQFYIGFGTGGRIVYTDCEYPEGHEGKHSFFETAPSGVAPGEGKADPAE